MSVIIMSNPRFNPMLKVIFSDRDNVHPNALVVLENKSSQVLSENSCSRSERIHSRIKNSLESVKITSPNARTRNNGLSVNTKSTKQTGGTREWSPDSSRYRSSSIHPGVRSRIQSATEFIARERRSPKRKNLHKA